MGRWAAHDITTAVITSSYLDWLPPIPPAPRARTPVRSSMCTPSSMISLMAWLRYPIGVTEKTCHAGETVGRKALGGKKIYTVNPIIYTNFTPKKRILTRMWVGCPETNSKKARRTLFHHHAQRLQILILLMQELPSTSGPKLKVSESKTGVRRFDLWHTKKIPSPRPYYKKEAAEGCRLV